MPRVAYNTVPNSIALFPYQKATIKKINRYFRSSANSNKSFLVSYPMGGGKSHVISSMALIESGSVLILAPSLEIKDLIFNKIKFFQNLTGWKKKNLSGLEEWSPGSVNGHRIAVDTYQMLYSVFSRKPEYYTQLKKYFSWVLIDEGHREPSPKWSFAIRNLESKKILFTATPYRNDFNIFEIADDAIHIESYSKLLGIKVRGLPILREIVHLQKDWKKTNVNSFINIFKKEFDIFCKPRKLKAIIRCEDYRNIKKIVKKLNTLKPGMASGVHTNFEKTDGDKALYRSYFEAIAANDCDVFVHQYKLIEGVDNRDFALLAFFEDLKSERSLIQQIGRVLRYKDISSAKVLSHSKSNVPRIWEMYCKFDIDLGKHKSLWGLRKFSREYLKNINKILYENTSFRELLNFDIDNIAAFQQLLFKKTVNVYDCSHSLDFDEKIADLEQDFADTNKIFRIRKKDVSSTFKYSSLVDDFYIICFISIENTQIFSDTFFPEIKMALAGIFYIDNKLFYYCSDRRSAPTLQKKLETTSCRSMVGIFGKDPIFKQVSLNNMDISDGAIRQRIVRARNLNEALSSNMDYASYLGNAVYKNKKSRGYLGIENSKITEFVSKTLTQEQFFEWIISLQETLAKSTRREAFLERFAQVVDVKGDETLVPKHILLDIIQAEDFFDLAEDKKEYLEAVMDLDKAYDICSGGDASQDYYFKIGIKGKIFRIGLTQKKNRFYLVSTFKSEQGSDEEESEILKVCIGELNARQLFRIIFQGKNFVYSLGRYFALGDLRSLKNIIYGDPSISKDWSEKGDELLPRGATKVHTWLQSLFKYIVGYSPTSSKLLYSELKGIDYLVCDDRGGVNPSEVADFIAIKKSNDRKKIILIHCKSKKGDATHATALYDVTAQAIKNLRILNPFYSQNIDEARFVNNRKLKAYDIPRIKSYNGNSRSARRFLEDYKKLLSDPTSEREVWIVMGGGLLAGQIESALSQEDASIDEHLVQAKFILYSTWASVSSSNAKLKIFCPKS